MVSTHQILFSGPMVRALLAGAKTQSRRVITPQPVGWQRAPQPGNSHLPRCRYGSAGDLLWVRENWRLWQGSAFSTMSGDPLDPDIIVGSLSGLDPDFLRTRPLEYRAETGAEGPWRPNIYMPRWASRVTLRLTEIRVEQLQEIDEADAQAEGAPFVRSEHDELGAGYRAGFATLWDSINSRRGFGFDTNPWVWVLRFDVIPRNVDEITEVPVIGGHERAAQAAMLSGEVGFRRRTNAAGSLTTTTYVGGQSWL